MVIYIIPGISLHLTCHVGSDRGTGSLLLALTGPDVKSVLGLLLALTGPDVRSVLGLLLTLTGHDVGSDRGTRSTTSTNRS